MTRHLDFELKQTDWDVMILHYLGLDHVGHIEGPFAPVNIRRKLHEMDEVIRLIFSSLNENDLMLVLSDHGMANEGGHGGSSQMEITTPVLFLTKSTAFLNEQNQANAQNKEIKSFQQIDLLSTLSCLFNLKVPNENQGVMFINDLFASIEQSCAIQDEQKLQIQAQIFKCLIDNADQLKEMIQSNETSSYQRAVNNFKAKFHGILNNRSIEIQLKLKEVTDLNQNVENLIRREQSVSRKSQTANTEQIFFMLCSIFVMINVSLNEL